MFSATILMASRTSLLGVTSRKYYTSGLLHNSKRTKRYDVTCDDEDDTTNESEVAAREATEGGTREAHNEGDEAEDDGE